MSTYFEGNSEMEGDGIQTLVLMNPGYVQYSESGSEAHRSSSTNLVYHNALAQQFVGIPQENGNGVWNTMEAPRGPQQQGLSLSLSAGPSRQTQSVMLSSKYLKAAQELLEEVVNVNTEGGKRKAKAKAKVKAIAISTGEGDTETGKRSSCELSSADRQEIHMKKAKLMTMLDEVEQRYRQYHHQMEIVVSSFEQAAGSGSATSYTALALQTISKQFRCLKDAIGAQIGAASNTLREEDCGSGRERGEGSKSRLRYVDHHLRQQRALQHLGMIQHNAWRPQRGLPERSVSVLRAWLFEHFLHPYPKDSDKHMLARQTGLTRSQVSNWFINARVRLWKPMVEEMYREEMKENQQNGSDEKTNEDPSSAAASQTQTQTFNSKQDVSASQNSPVAGENLRAQSGFSFIGSSELEGVAQASPKKPRNLEVETMLPSINMDVKPNEPNNQPVPVKFGVERQSREGHGHGHGYSFMGNQTNLVGGFGQYSIGDIAEQFTPRFSGNGVSLTLGLDSLPPTHQTFLPNQNIQRLDIAEPNDFGAINTSTPHSAPAFQGININMQNPKRFAAQLLPDFVT